MVEKLLSLDVDHHEDSHVRYGDQRGASDAAAVAAVSKEPIRQTTGECRLGAAPPPARVPPAAAVAFERQ